MNMAWDLRGISSKNGTTKARIERAAVRLFARHGIDGVSTKQIAQAAGISEGAIYRHFASKDGLARDLMTAIHTRLTEMIETAGMAHSDLSETVGFIARHYCQIADDDWDLFQYHILHLHHFSRLTDNPDQSPIGAAAELLEVEMDNGTIPRSDPYVLASMALGVVLQVAQAKVMGYVSAPLSDFSDTFTDAVLRVLSPSQEAN